MVVPVPLCGGSPSKGALQTPCPVERRGEAGRVTSTPQWQCRTHFCTTVFNVCSGSTRSPITRPYQGPEGPWSGPVPLTTETRKRGDRRKRQNRSISEMLTQTHSLFHCLLARGQSLRTGSSLSPLPCCLCSNANDYSRVKWQLGQPPLKKQNARITQNNFFPFRLFFFLKKYF